MGLISQWYLFSELLTTYPSVAYMLEITSYDNFRHHGKLFKTRSAHYVTCTFPNAQNICKQVFSKIESLTPLIWTQQGGEWLKIKKLFHGWKVLNSNWLGHGIPVRLRYLTEELEVRCKIELYSQLSRLLLPCSAIAECLRLKLFIFWSLCATSHELTFAS